MAGSRPQMAPPRWRRWRRNPTRASPSGAPRLPSCTSPPVRADPRTTTHSLCLRVLRSLGSPTASAQTPARANPPARADPGVVVSPFLAPPCPHPQDARPQSRSCCPRGSLLPQYGPCFFDLVHPYFDFLNMYFLLMERQQSSFIASLPYFA